MKGRTMATEHPVMRVFDIYGDYVDMEFSDWEEYYNNGLAKYIGSCIQKGDSVTFRGNLEQGQLIVHDRSEKITDKEWQIEIQYILTDEEKLELEREMYREYTDMDGE